MSLSDLERTFQQKRLFLFRLSLSILKTITNFTQQNVRSFEFCCLPSVTCMKQIEFILISRLHSESDDEYSDDDDMSWKVRRSSIKCLEALISTRLDLLLSFYSSICPALLARFKEREENVRADVFTAFSTLLRQTRVASSRHSLIVSGSDPGVRREEEPAVALLKKQVLRSFWMEFN